MGLTFLKALSWNLGRSFYYGIPKFFRIVWLQSQDSNLSTTLQKCSKGLKSIECGVHFNTENSCRVSWTNLSLFLICDQHLVVIKDECIVVIKLSHVVNHNTLVDCDIFTIFYWYQRSQCIQRKYSPYHYTATSNLNYGYKTEWCYTFVLLTLNYGPTIRMPW